MYFSGRLADTPVNYMVTLCCRISSLTKLVIMSPMSSLPIFPVQLKIHPFHTTQKKPDWCQRVPLSVSISLPFFRCLSCFHVICLNSSSKRRETICKAEEITLRGSTKENSDGRWSQRKSMVRSFVNALYVTMCDGGTLLCLPLSRFLMHRTMSVSA